MTRIKRFTTEPELEAVYHGPRQDYVYKGSVPHTRRDGTPTLLGKWMTQCAECGRWFEFRTPLLCAPENRRCPMHKAPGQRVERRRKHAGVAK